MDSRSYMLASLKIQDVPESRNAANAIESIFGTTDSAAYSLTYGVNGRFLQFSSSRCSFQLERP
jgi:hypothetical protein